MYIDPNNFNMSGISWIAATTAIVSCTLCSNDRIAWKEAARLEMELLASSLRPNFASVPYKT